MIARLDPKRRGRFAPGWCGSGALFSAESIDIRLHCARSEDLHSEVSHDLAQQRNIKDMMVEAAILEIRLRPGPKLGWTSGSPVPGKVVEFENLGEMGQIRLRYIVGFVLQQVPERGDGSAMIEIIVPVGQNQ